MWIRKKEWGVELALYELIKVVYSLPDNERDGVINYIITKLLTETITNPMNYFNLERAIGILECCKLEYYRRKSYYEDEKIEENGDI